MGKKSRARREPAAASARTSHNELEGLITFLQQLMRDGHYQEALRAGRTMVEEYPLNPLAHAVLGSVLAQLNNAAEALRQFELAQRLGMDRDPMLLHSLAVAASTARYPIHAVQAARGGAALPNATDEQRQAFASLMEITDSYIGDLVGSRSIGRDVAEEALLIMERGARALAAEETDRARRLAEEATELTPAWPLVWNNLAMLLFQFNDVPGAIAACRRVLDDVDGDDPILRSTLVRIHAVTGHRDEAEAELEWLLATGDTSPMAQVEIAKAQAILGRDAAVHERLSQVDAAALHPVGRFLRGIAAANLGRLDEARADWRNLAREGLPQARIFTDILGRQEEPPTPDGRFTYFAAAELVPSTVLDEAASLVASGQDAERVRAFAREFPLLPVALCETYYAPNVDPRLATDLLLSLDDASVARPIATFAASRAQGDYNRVYAHVALRAAGLEDPVSAASVWIGGRRREIVLPALRIVLPPDRGYDPAVRELFTQGAEAQQRDDTEAAIGLYERILALDPQAAEAEHNLGTALLLSNRIEQGAPHLERTLELDPEHVLARCNLASLALVRGDAAGAHALMDPLDERRTFTLEEAVAYLRTRSDLARADGDLERAEALLHTLLAFDSENALARERLGELRAPVAAGRR